MSLPIPAKVPEKGFYYHYKHDPAKGIGDHAYEVVGVGFHTEDDARPGEEHFLIYRPLYNQSVYLASKDLGIPCYDARPLTMWMEDVTKDGKTFPRFQKILDPEIIAELKTIRTQMYEKLWFKRKSFGWGWTPVSWEGWTVVLGYVALVLLFSLTVNEYSPSSEIFFTAVLPVILLTIALIRICYTKGEAPRWQWGIRKQD